MLYNKADTPYWKAAQRILVTSEKAFTELEKRFGSPAAPAAETDEEAEPAPPTPTSSKAPPANAIGDLEPPLELLELLLDREGIQNERGMKYILDKLPLDALFSYELGELKPVTSPTPPPPSPTPAIAADPSIQTPAPKARSHKRDRKRSQSSVQVPRTRRALNAAAAFEAEINGQLEGASTAVDSQAVEQPVIITVGPGMGLDVDMTATPTSPTTVRRKHRRPTITLPGQSDVPPVVDNVDNQQSF